MDTSTGPSYRGYRFPCEIVAHCNWLHFRFNLSSRDIQEMMLERGVEVSHQAIRLWCLKFGTEYARRVLVYWDTLKAEMGLPRFRDRPSPGGPTSVAAHVHLSAPVRSAHT